MALNMMAVSELELAHGAPARAAPVPFHVQLQGTLPFKPMTTHVTLIHKLIWM